MRFNKQELIALASQPSQKFDREGILLVKEKQEGFFRRAESLKAVPITNPAKDAKREVLRSLSCVGVSGKVSLERWFRLCGNLLFYLRGPEQWSEPLGVIVLEQCTVRAQAQDECGHWPFQIVWEGGLCCKMAAPLEAERSGWLQAIQAASYSSVRANMLALRRRLERRKGPDPDMDVHMWRVQRGLAMDMNEVPLCELSLSCDNLLCDAQGRPPSPLVVVHVRTTSGNWIRYATTEVVETSSNPTFARTISFRASDGLSGATAVRVSVSDMREHISQTSIPMGSAKLLLSTIQDTQRLRIALTAADSKTVGFVTLNGWSLEPCAQGASPKHAPGPASMEPPQRHLSHRRSHSLPPRLGVKLRLPAHGPVLRHHFANAAQSTYRFHSGLGGDISVHELMAEPKVCFQVPQQLLGIFIQREKELLQEVICMGELGGKWKARQMELLDAHLSLLKHYSQARQSLQTFLHSSNGKYFKQSSRKGDANLEFAPVNLHLQRMWVNNDTLNKSGFYDIITVGAFTAHCQKAGKSGGLLRLLQQMKDVGGSKVSLNCPSASRVLMANDAVQAIKQLRGDIVHIMRRLLALAKVKQSTGMMPLAEEMIAKTRSLLSLWDSGLVEEALCFIDAHKVPAPPVPSAQLGANIAARPQVLSPFKQLTEQLCMLDLKSPELEDFATPSTPHTDPNAWPLCDVTKMSSSVPNVFNTDTSSVKPMQTSSKINFGSQGEMKPPDQLKFYNEHFKNEAKAYANLDKFQSLQFHNDADHSQSSPIDQPLNSEYSPRATAGEAQDCSSLTVPTERLRPSSGTQDKGQDVDNSDANEMNPSSSSDVGDSLVFQMSLEENGNVEHCQEIEPINEGVPCTDPIANQYLDVAAMTNSPSANYYQPSDEPEPWDLTQLNIEASVMCLVSKVKFLCGRCGSPAVRLRSQKTNQSSTMARTFTKPALKSDFITAAELCDSATSTTPRSSNQPLEGRACLPGPQDGADGPPLSAAVIDDAPLNPADTPQKVVRKGNKFTDGLNLEEVAEWASELRPPMRKLRQAMDGLLKSGRLAHAVLRVRCEPAQRTRAHAALQIRRDTCFSQALTALVSGLQCWLCSSEPETVARLLRGGLGPLCGFEGLLSLHKAEKAMWGDMVVAVEDLQTVTFTLARSNHSTSCTPQVTGSRGSLTVLLPVPEALYTRFHSKEELSFTVTAVFFNIGINDMATLAESFGETAPQEQSNCDNFERLNVYYHKYKKIFPTNASSISRASCRVKPLEEIMENLRNAVQKKTPKNVAVLHLAATATRLMNGIRATSCKSAKDRTGMSCTLEQCTVLTSEYHMAEHEFTKALDCMRSEGCRRENTMKNTGVRKYAFNKLQIMALPKKYRPPAGCYGSSQT